MGDQQDEGLFREIEEEMRQEQLKRLWQRYGKFLIAAAVLVVVVVAGYQGWQYYERDRALSESRRFAEALHMLQEGRTQEARDAFSALGTDGATGYAMLARFREAAMLANQDQRRAAADAYGAIAADSGLPDQYRAIATLLSALHEVDTADPAALRERIQPLAADDSPWRHSAREALALVALRAGEQDRAAELYGQLAEDSAAPAGIRSRAQDMRAALGGS